MKTLLVALALTLALPARALDPVQKQAWGVGIAFAAAGFAVHAASHPDSPFQLRHEWTNSDTAMLVLAEVALALDWMTTLDIRHHPGTYEVNSLLGKHPSDAAVNQKMALNMVGHAVIAYLLPNPYRKVWQGLFIGFEFDLVRNNLRPPSGLS